MQNLCSEAVCYAELLKRKIERNQLGQDHRTFIMQVLPLSTGEGNGLSFYREKRSVLSSRPPWQHLDLSTFLKGFLCCHACLFLLSFVCNPVGILSGLSNFALLILSLFFFFCFLCSSLWHLTTRNMCECICPTCPGSWTGGLWRRLWRSHVVLRARSK